jgi:hypothetical protein
MMTPKIDLLQARAYAAEGVRLGSKCEILIPSRYLPLFLRHYTMQLRFGSAMSFDNRLIAARCVGGAWSLGEASFAEWAVMERPLLADIVEKVLFE